MYVEVIAAGPTPNGSFEVLKDHNKFFTFVAETITLYEKRPAWVTLAYGEKFNEVYSEAWNKIHNPVKCVFIEPGVGLVDVQDMPLPSPMAAIDRLLLPTTLENGDELWFSPLGDPRDGERIWGYRQLAYTAGLMAVTGPAIILGRTDRKICSPKTTLTEALQKVVWYDDFPGIR